MTGRRAPEWNCAPSLGETAWAGIASIRSRWMGRVSRACSAPSLSSKTISDVRFLSDRVHTLFLFRVLHPATPHLPSAFPPEYALRSPAGGVTTGHATRSRVQLGASL